MSRSGTHDLTPPRCGPPSGGFALGKIAMSATACRKIGSVGTATRVLVGAAMLYGAFAIDGLQLSDAVLGAVVFPGTILLGHWLRNR